MQELVGDAVKIKGNKIKEKKTKSFNNKIFMFMNKYNYD